MKNIDKIAHLDNMIAKCQQSIDFNKVKLDMQTEAAGKEYHQNIHILFHADLLALKFGRKAIQLMVDLVNDVDESDAEWCLPTKALQWLESLPYNNKVKARLKRQMIAEKVAYRPRNLGGAIIFSGSPEGYEYWDAVCFNHSNPDQHLPADYIDVDSNEGGQQ